MSPREKQSASKTAPPYQVSRRRLLRDSALAAGAVTGIGFPAHAIASAAAGERLAVYSTQESLDSYAPVALTAEEMTTLKAAMSRLIPNDDLGPGAVEAGAYVYVDRMLATDDDTLALFQDGLAALNQSAESGAFADLAAEAQDDLLTQAQENSLTGAPEGFFGLLLEHTRRGMFGDPVHGGNLDFAGWDLVGYPGIKLVWTEEEQAIDAVVEPAYISVEQFRDSES